MSFIQSRQDRVAPSTNETTLGGSYVEDVDAAILVADSSSVLSGTGVDIAKSTTSEKDDECRTRT